MNKKNSIKTKAAFGALALLSTALGVTAAVQPATAVADSASPNFSSSTAVKTITPLTSTQLKSKLNKIELKANMQKGIQQKSTLQKGTSIKTGITQTWTNGG